MENSKGGFVSESNQNTKSAKLVNPKGSKKKGLLSLIFIVALIFIVTLYFLISGISTYMGLQKGVTLDELFTTKSSSKYVDTTANYSTIEFLEVTRKVNQLIPIGKDYYFIIFNKDTKQYICVRADKSWTDKFNDGVGFDTDGIKFSTKGIKLKGKISEYKTEYRSQVKPKEFLLKLGINSSDIKDGYYIDTKAEKFAILKMIAGFLILIIVISGIVFYKRTKYDINKKVPGEMPEDKVLDKFLAWFILIGSIAWIILLFYILSLE